MRGATRHATGEVVFTTGMSGYQESMTDPSFARQLITFTYPHIGNYGAGAAAMESDRPWARAAIMRAATNAEDAPDAERGWLDWLADCGIPAITGVDTRALVRHIRDEGAMRGGVFPGAMRRAQAHGADRGRAADGRPRPRARGHPRADWSVAGDGDVRIAAIDTGIKGSIVRNLVAARRDGRAAPVHRDRRRADSPTTPTRSSWPTAPATRPRSTTSSPPSAS